MESSGWYKDKASPSNSESRTGNRCSIKESDSTYAKLCKQGGHRNLLSYGDQSDVCQSKSWKAPDYMVHEKAESPSSPIKTDSIKKDDSGWARKQAETNQKRFSSQFAPFHTTEFDNSKSFIRTGRKQFTPTKKKNNASSDVNDFGSLISGGYANQTSKNVDSVDTSSPDTNSKEANNL